MKLFYSNAAAKEEIANLEGQITALKTEGESTAGQVAALTADLATANASLATMTAERDEAVTAYETSEKAAALVAADLVAANAKLATFDDAVEAAAQAKFAGLGGPPIAENSGEEPEDDISGLTGLAKVTAIFKAQNASKTSTKSK